MKNYEKKDKNVVENIIRTMEKLDYELAKLNTLEQDKKKHALKRWFIEKKALHEIKYILHEANLYETYDEKEMVGFEDYINTLM